MASLREVVKNQNDKLVAVEGKQNRAQIVTETSKSLQTAYEKNSPDFKDLSSIQPVLDMTQNDSLLTMFAQEGLSNAMDTQR